MLTFQDCQKMKIGTKLDHNTTLVKHDVNIYGVKLYGTIVVFIHQNGDYTLNSGGWKTSTTKDRINKFSPFRVYVEKGKWFVGDKPFNDHMTLNVEKANVDHP